MFSAKECHHSLDVVQTNLNRFTFLGYLVPVCPWPLLNSQLGLPGSWGGSHMAGPLVTKARQVLCTTVPAFDRFWFRFLHNHPMSNEEISHHSLSPWRVQGINKTGAAWCCSGVISGNDITTPMQCSPRHNASHLHFGGTLPLTAAYRYYPSVMEKPEVGFLRGNNIWLTKCY
jgi:hypothetical protein